MLLFSKVIILLAFVKEQGIIFVLLFFSSLTNITSDQLEL